MGRRMSRRSRLGPIFAAHRKRRRLSLRDVENSTGIPFNTIARIERGAAATFENAIRLGAFYGIDAVSLCRIARVP